MYISKYPEPDEDPKSMEISHSNKNDVQYGSVCMDNVNICGKI